MTNVAALWLGHRRRRECLARRAAGNHFPDASMIRTASRGFDLVMTKQNASQDQTPTTGAVAATIRTVITQHTVVFSTDCTKLRRSLISELWISRDCPQLRFSVYTTTVAALSIVKYRR